MTNHDKLFKELLTTFFADFLALFAPEMSDSIEPSSIVFLEKEIFSDVTTGDVREVDLLVQAKRRDNDSFFLVHTESQSDSQKNFDRRMFRYFARLHEKYTLPIYPIALLTFDRPLKQQASVYEVRFPDLDVLRFRYLLVQLNQLDWRAYLAQPNPIAAALMAKMRIAPADRPRVRLECLRMLVTLKLDMARTRLISGFVDAYLRLSSEEEELFDSELASLTKSDQEDIMEITTSWTEKGIKIGLEQGLEQGLARGLEQGRVHEANRLIVKLLSKRFGTIQSTLLERIQLLSVTQLEELAEAVLDFGTIADLQQWLGETDS